MSKPNTRAIIDANIRQNGQQLITGQVLNATLNAMVTDYAEQAALDGLKEKVDALALGAFYGYFPDSDSLPTDVTTPGYAYVGSDNPYEIWNFNGESWSDSGTSIDLNDADEEDITRNADGKLQFKDRDNTDGMGYVILRKDKTFVEQVTEENTIYEIRYDFDLEEDSVSLPGNCILYFNGGSLSSGTIVGQNSCIRGNLCAIFGENVSFAGSWVIPYLSTGMFQVADGESIIKLIQLCNSDIHNTLVVEDGNYEVDLINETTTYFSHAIKVDKNNVDVVILGNVKITPNESQNYSIFQLRGVQNVHIMGDGHVIGDKDQHDYSEEGTHEWGFGVQMYGCENVSVSGLHIHECTGDGVIVNNCKNVRIGDVEIYNCRRQGISITDNSHNVEIANFDIHNIKGTAPQSAIDVEPNNVKSENVFIHNGLIHDCVSGIESFIREDMMSEASNSIKIEEVTIRGNENFNLFFNNNPNWIVVKNCRFYGVTSRFAHSNVVMDSCVIESDGHGIEMTYTANLKVFNSEIQASFDRASFLNSSVFVGNSRLPIILHTGTMNTLVFENCDLYVNTGTWQSVLNTTIKDSKIHYNTTTAFQVIGSNVLDSTIDYSGKADQSVSAFILVGTNAVVENVKFVSSKAISATNAINLNSGATNVKIRNIYFDSTLTYTNFSLSLMAAVNVFVKNDVPMRFENVGSLPNDMRYIGSCTFKNGKPIWWTGTKWVDATGADA